MADPVILPNLMSEGPHDEYLLKLIRAGWGNNYVFFDEAFERRVQDMYDYYDEKEPAIVRMWGEEG